MKSFEYLAPASIGEAVALLADKDKPARPLVGGTDLLVQLRLNRVELERVVDVKKIPELNQLVYDPAEGLTVGAAVCCARLVEQPEVAAAYPGLIDAASIIGGTAIQGRASLGGNLCNAAPSGDAISAMLMLGATCLIAGPTGRRVMPAEAFCRGPGQTELGRGELLVSIHFPPPQRYTGARYLRFTPRREMDIAVAGAGAWLALSDDLTTIMAARIALAAVAPTPLLAWSAGESLRGKAPTEAAFAAAAALAQAEAKPITDVRGSAAQRRHLTGTRTSVAMQAAEVLGLPLERIKSSVADTDSIGYSDVSGGSRTTVATGAAAVEAARDVIRQMSERAAQLWQVAPEAVSYRQGRFAAGQDRAKQMSFAELAALIPETGGPITGRGNLDVREWGGAFGAHIADVEVDPETGQAMILRYTVIQDVGKAIHPGQVEGQMQGAAVQGIGWALFEGYVYSPEGQVLNPNLLDYKLPTALDVPLVETVIVEVPYPGQPYGARGVGEVPIVPPAAAVANAIYRATGQRMIELPITPARVLERLGVI